jgi:hypothetical protein
MVVAATVYILISVIALAGIAAGMFFIGRKKPKQPTGMAMAGMFLVVFSMFFDDRLIAYSLIFLGVAISLFAALRASRKAKPK